MSVKFPLPFFLIKKEAKNQEDLKEISYSRIPSAFRNRFFPTLHALFRYRETHFRWSLAISASLRGLFILNDFLL